MGGRMSGTRRYTQTSPWYIAIRVMRTMTALTLVLAVLTCASGCGDDAMAPPPDGNGSSGSRTWYVNKEAQDLGSGTSWKTAFNHPQRAIDVARSGDIIWVSEGIYRSRSPGDPMIPVLTLKDGISLYGGFTPGDTSLADRDPATRPTELNGDDMTNHVVVGATNSLLDGFIVTSGYANGIYPDNVGAGMINDGASTLVMNCTFSGNRATWHGGAVFNRNSAAEIIGCAFTDNHATNNGGAIYNDSEGAGGIHPVIRDCTFDNNRNSRFGGAVFNHYCPAEITGCAFSGNFANHNGGGIYNTNSEARIADCILSGNMSVNGGGIYINAIESGYSPHIENCLFTDNEAFMSGGALYTYIASPVVTNCTFSGNTAQYGGAISNWSSESTITNCIAWGDTALFYDDEIYMGGGPLPVVRFSDINQDGFGIPPTGAVDDNGNMRYDPRFVWGPLGTFYLSHEAAGEIFTSPCVDAGSGIAAEFGLGDKTTRTDGEPDGGTVDMGYHYPIP